jgi:hypothetical protein
MNSKKIIAAIVALFFMLPVAASACPSCYGALDSPRKTGMNMAIVAMIGVTGFVLTGISSFFIMMRHRINVLRNHSAATTFINE